MARLLEYMYIYLMNIHQGEIQRESMVDKRGIFRVQNRTAQSSVLHLRNYVKINESMISHMNCTCMFDISHHYTCTVNKIYMHVHV